MASNPKALESAAEQLAVTLPTPRQTWLGKLVSTIAGACKRTKEHPKKSVATLPLPSVARLEESQAESSFGTSSVLPPTVLYLAYGSNLCHQVFQGRRGIKPISAVSVVVPELSFTFDLPGVPYIEPCFANSAHRKVNGAMVHDVSIDPLYEKKSLLSTAMDETMPLVGVVYEVTGNDYYKIIATEGSAYTDVVVECHALPSSETVTSAAAIQQTFKAHTLLAPSNSVRPRQSSGPAQPSLRYLTLCRTGAAEHNLPLDWQRYLNNLQHYHTTSVRQVAGKAIFVLVWAPIVLLSFGIRRLLGGKDGNASPTAKALAQSVLRMMWISYDNFFKYVFGDGERTQSRCSSQRAELV